MRSLTKYYSWFYYSVIAISNTIEKYIEQYYCTLLQMFVMHNIKRWEYVKMHRKAKIVDKSCKKFRSGRKFAKLFFISFIHLPCALRISSQVHHHKLQWIRLLFCAINFIFTLIVCNYSVSLLNSIPIICSNFPSHYKCVRFIVKKPHES